MVKGTLSRHPPTWTTSPTALAGAGDTGRAGLPAAAECQIAVRSLGGVLCAGCGITVSRGAKTSYVPWHGGVGLARAGAFGSALAADEGVG
jgi:hypothetical protein